MMHNRIEQDRKYQKDARVTCTSYQEHWAEQFYAGNLLLLSYSPAMIHYL